MNTHLTNEQFTELMLGGAPDAACELHLAECARCREEVAVFSQSVGLFSTTSLHWSEAKPARSLRLEAERKAKWVYASVGWALAAGVLILAGVPAWNYEHRVVTPAVVAQDSATEIAQDNALLANVNVALSASEDSPLPEYRLSGRFSGKAAGTRTR